MSMKIKRPDYAAQYGPTTGDKVYLADTGLVAEIEHDYTTYGDELVFGGGNYWFGRLVITTTFSPNEMFDFYANQLPSFGWDAITSLRSTVSVLTYAREDRVVTIQIEKRTIRGAEVTVIVSPRGGSQPPPALPATVPQVLPSR